MGRWEMLFTSGWRERGNVMFMWLGNENVSASWKVDRQEAYFIRLQHIGSDWHVVHLARNIVAYANEKTLRHMLHSPQVCVTGICALPRKGLGFLIKYPQCQKALVCVTAMTVIVFILSAVFLTSEVASLCSCCYNSAALGLYTFWPV